MKSISIAALALLGKVSADDLVSIGEKLRTLQKSQLTQKTFQDVHLDEHGYIVLGDKTVLQMTKTVQNKNQIKKGVKPSDELCDGDKDDDRELEDENDPNDPIADDNGFVKQFKGARVQLADKPSDELCDGDSADDKELEDENDPNDVIADDNGFVRQWAVQLGSKVHLKNHLKNKTLLQEKPSNELCDGDSADDKELEDENDPEDPIVDDNGFVRQWAVQLKSKINMGNGEKPSDEICDGDSADDKELEDENDPNDLIVDDNGFVRQWLVQLDE